MVIGQYIQFRHLGGHHQRLAITYQDINVTVTLINGSDIYFRSQIGQQLVTQIIKIVWNLPCTDLPNARNSFVGSGDVLRAEPGLRGVPSVVSVMGMR